MGSTDQHFRDKEGIFVLDGKELSRSNREQVKLELGKCQGNTKISSRR